MVVGVGWRETAGGNGGEMGVSCAGWWIGETLSKNAPSTEEECQGVGTKPIVCEVGTPPLRQKSGPDVPVAVAAGLA